MRSVPLASVYGSHGNIAPKIVVEQNDADSLKAALSSQTLMHDSHEYIKQIIR